LIFKRSRFVSGRVHGASTFLVQDSCIPIKALEKLGWTPKTSFADLVAEMVRGDLKIAERDELTKLNRKKEVAVWGQEPLCVNFCMWMTWLMLACM
jgi:hypothetical protein